MVKQRGKDPVIKSLKKIIKAARKMSTKDYREFFERSQKYNNSEIGCEAQDQRSELMKDPEFAKEAFVGDFVIDVTEQIVSFFTYRLSVFSEMGVHKNDGIPYLRLLEILRGGDDATLREIALIAHAHGKKVKLTFKRG